MQSHLTPIPLRLQCHAAAPGSVSLLSSLLTAINALSDEIGDTTDTIGIATRAAEGQSTQQQLLQAGGGVAPGYTPSKAEYDPSEEARRRDPFRHAAAIADRQRLARCQCTLAGSSS